LLRAAKISREIDLAREGGEEAKRLTGAGPVNLEGCRRMVRTWAGLNSHWEVQAGISRSAEGPYLAFLAEW
jgi:hypothetical protein